LPLVRRQSPRAGVEFAAGLDRGVKPRFRGVPLRAQRRSARSTRLRAPAPARVVAGGCASCAASLQPRRAPAEPLALRGPLSGGARGGAERGLPLARPLDRGLRGACPRPGARVRTRRRPSPRARPAMSCCAAGQPASRAGGDLVRGVASRTGSGRSASSRRISGCSICARGGSSGVRDEIEPRVSAATRARFTVFGARRRRHCGGVPAGDAAACGGLFQRRDRVERVVRRRTRARGRRRARRDGAFRGAPSRSGSAGRLPSLEGLPVAAILAAARAPRAGGSGPQVDGRDPARRPPLECGPRDARPRARCPLVAGSGRRERDAHPRARRSVRSPRLQPAELAAAAREALGIAHGSPAMTAWALALPAPRSSRAQSPERPLHTAPRPRLR